jgi:predicted nucleic-acid-binding protein
MIGLDTNVIVRLFVDDDPQQARLARAFVAEKTSTDAPAFIDRVALCELVWVLASVHGYGRQPIADLIERLAANRGIRLEDDELVRLALRDYRTSNVDFADLLIGHVNVARGCEATATFDRKAAKLSGFVRVS